MDLREIGESPAFGVMQTYGDEESSSYTIACDCGESDHDCQVWIEAKKDEPHVSVSFYVKTWIYPKNWWERIKVACKVLFTGEYQSEHELLLKKQSAINFGSILTRDIYRFDNNSLK